jgi:hypothetical protein
MDDPSQFVGARCVSLETYRRDGRAVQTTVWFVESEGAILVVTAARSGKAKRIRNDPKARVAPCTFRGRLQGSWVNANVRFGDDDEFRDAVAVLNRKYGIARRLNGVYNAILRRPLVSLVITLQP